MWKLLGSHVFTKTTRHYYNNQFQKLEAAKSAYLRWRESVRRCFQQYLPSNSGPAAVLWLGMGPISWSLAQLHHNCSPAARTATFFSTIVPHYQYWYTRTHARLWNWGSVTVTSHTWLQGFPKHKNVRSCFSWILMTSHQCHYLKSPSPSATYTPGQNKTISITTQPGGWESGTEDRVPRYGKLMIVPFYV